MNPYYQLSLKEEFCNRLLEEFGLPVEGSHIINGHVPVKLKDGEKPMKAGGKLFIIDGGLSKAYQSTTGIAGYTLIYNSYGLILAAHEPFESTEAAIEKESDIHSESTIVNVCPAGSWWETRMWANSLRQRLKTWKCFWRPIIQGQLWSVFL